MGSRVDQGGKEGRLAEADAAARLRVVAEEVGSGAYLLMVEPEPTDEQGLRAPLRDGRSVHLYSYDATHGKALSPCIGFTKQFLRRLILGNPYRIFTEILFAP